MELALGFFLPLFFLLWLANKYPPIDLTEEYRKIDDKYNKELEDCKRSLRINTRKEK